MKFYLYLIILIIFMLNYCNTKEYTPINIIQSKEDLSLFNIQNAKLVINNVRNGGVKRENKIIMFNSDNYIPTFESVYEVQIDANFEVINFGKTVKLLDNGYILSGPENIKDKINIGDYVIFIEEINRIYVFEAKQEYKYAYFISAINNYLRILNNKMKEENLYDELYDSLLGINNGYEYALQNNRYIRNVFLQIKELYNNYMIKKVDLSKLKYSNRIELNTFQYIELFTKIEDAKPLNYINTLTVSHEGGFRAENELVRYDKSNILPRNQQGYEFAINSNGNIIDKGINVELPENGYILSGHGTSKKLIEDQLKIGDYLYYRNLYFNIYRDANVNIVNNIGKQIQTLIEKCIKLNNNKIPLHYDEISKKLNILINYYNSLNKEGLSFNIKSYFDFKIFDYESLILQIKFLFLETNPIQIQAIWHNPYSLFNIYDETKKEGIQNFLKACSEFGFNRIYLGVNHAGIARYNSNILISDHVFGKPYNEYKDYLECFIEEAHKLNIEVIAWIVTLLVKSSISSQLASCYKEEWLTIDYNGNKCTFLDSTNSEVHNFLISQISEIANNYNVDGIEYDYIRYDASNILSYPSNIIDYGYTTNSINLFKQKYGYSSSEDIKKILQDEKARINWVEFKKQKLTDLLYSLKQKLKMIKPNLILSAAVFYDPSYINRTMQDYPRWINEKLIDYVEPMIYQKDTNYFVNTLVGNFISSINNDEEYRKKKVIIGIGVVDQEGDYLEYLDQIQYISSLYFSYTIYCCKYILPFNKLKNVFKNYNYEFISYSASLENKIIILYDDLIKKIEEYYKNISQEDFSRLITYLNLCKNDKTELSVNKVYEEIDKLKDKTIKKNIYNIYSKINSK